MTNEQLNRLFESARSVPVETAPEDVATWVGAAAATSTGVLGLAGKLKLFIAKKTLVIMGTTLSLVSLGIITAVSMGSGTPTEKSPEKQTKRVLSVQLEEPATTQDVVEPEDTNRRVVVAQPTPPVPPAPPVEPTAPVLPTPPTEPVRGTTPIPPAPPAPPAPRTTVAVSAGSVDAGQGRVNCATSCKDKGKKVKASGNVIKKEYEVGAFTKLNIAGTFDVVLIQGDAPKVEFEADDNLQEYFEAKVKGDELFIDMENVSMEDKKSNTVYVTFKDLHALKYSGVGDVKTEGKIELESLECTISGVGDLDLKMNCEDLDVNFTGVGDVTLSGNGNKANYEWSGVGDLQAKDLETKDVSLKLSGVGDAKVSASEKLEIKLTGLGDVEYKGSPKSKEFSTTGMGDIKGS